MNEISTKHKIGDLVYTANVHDVDRDVIKAIKVEGVKEDVSYGIKRKGGDSLFSFWYSSDDYIWYKTSEIFTSREEAVSKHEALKAKEEAKEAKREQKKRAKRLEELKKEQAALESGEEYDPYEDDDDDY